MSAISKLHNAVMSIPQDLTVAAANFNLDFSLMKVEAPKEFHGVRDALSTHRRGDAEEGTAHVTARKLGALFEAKVPKIQHLIEAYGKRVSAISSRSNSEAKGHLDHFGLFEGQIGPDGTSIWAAATSGQAAIAVHLLACMLARIWKGNEATSIWVELVEKRKQEISNTYNITNRVETAAIMAARQSFSRQQLAALDASARSWLRTADADRKQQQTQLMLIVNNVGIPVNSKKDPYDSVLEAWISGVSAMENLVKGIPQRVRNGAVLLAMSAWHLYPNMEVLADEIKHINQHDDLMNGALLTISRLAANDNRNGVFWSLPLARMRYYSPPVVTERLLASETSRVSMAELWIVVLGNLVGQWTDISSEKESLCRTIIRLSGLVNQPLVRIVWLNCLAEAATKYTAANSADGQQYRRLFGLGMRLRKPWLNEPSDPTTDIFGLRSFCKLLDIFDDNEGIKVMRQIAETLEAPLEDLVIRYPERQELQSGYSPSLSPSPSLMEEEGEQRSCYRHFRFASIRPSSTRWPMAPRDEAEPSAKRPRLGFPPRGDVAVHYDFPGATDVRHIDRYHFWLVNSNKHEIVYDFVLGNPDRVAIFSRNKTEVTQCDGERATIDIIERVLSLSVDKDRLHDRLLGGRPIDILHDRFLGGRPTDIFDLTSPDQQRLSLYALSFANDLYQGLEKATISIQVVNQPMYESSWAPRLCGTDPAVKDSLLENPETPPARIRDTTFGEQLEDSLSITQENVCPSLFSQLKKPLVKDSLGGEYIRHRITPRDPSTSPLFNLPLSVHFACIAMFESGEFNIDPESLAGVMALSSGDSIYVASHLVSDPNTSSETYQRPIRRVFGNLGRPEMAFLIPPLAPKLKDYNPES